MSTTDILSQHFYRSDFSARAYNVLERNGIQTVEELASKTERELRSLRWCGRKVANELICFLLDRGLDISAPDPERELAGLREKVRALEAENKELKAELSNLREW
jgi:DNA-directed RNA polymerase alpha subunit